MLCPTTMRFLALGGLALVVIVGVVLLATRRPILGLVIGLCVLAVGGLLVLPAFWFSARSVAVRTAADMSAAPVLPDLPPAAGMAPSRLEAAGVRVSVGQGTPVISISVPEECKRGIESACLDLQQDIWKSLGEFASDVQATDREVEALQQRLRRTNLWELAARLLKNLEERGSIRVEPDSYAMAVCDDEPVPPVDEQASFHADEIRLLLDEMRIAVPRQAARPRSVLLSMLGVVATLLIAYWLLKGGLRHAATMHPPAPRHHG